MESVITIQISYEALSLILSLFYFIPAVFIIVVLLLISINRKIDKIKKDEGEVKDTSYFEVFKKLGGRNIKEESVDDILNK